MRDLTVVVPYFNGAGTIERLIRSIDDDTRIIVVDDLSDTKPHLTNGNVQVVRLDDKRYFSGAVNHGMSLCDTDVLVLNQDLYFTNDGWKNLIEENRGEFAMIGDGVFGNPKWPEGYVQGTFMYMRRDAIDEVGDLNELQYPLWGATAEWQCRACRKGYKVLPYKPVPGMGHARDQQTNKHYGSAIQTILQRHPENREWYIRTPPLVSVIVPCFNHGRYLNDLLASLTGGDSSLGELPGQTMQSFEVIIVNDASRDSTKEIADSLADPWKGIRVYHHMLNAGTAAANNTGAQHAYGEYLTFISADDMMEPERLKRMLDAAERNPHSVIYDDMRVVVNGQRSKYWQMPNYNFDLLLEKNHIHAGIMIERDAWVEVGGYPEIMTQGREDWAFNVALGVHGYCGVHIEYAGYLYRREGQNRTLWNTTPKWREKFRRQIKSLFPKVYQGERPVSCCGGRRKPVVERGNPVPTKVGLSGEDGMLMIEYIGGNVGTSTWVGPVTKTPYVFGGTRKVGYVDARDAQAMVDLRINRSQTFRMYTPAKKAKPVAVKPVEPQVEPEAVPLDDSVGLDPSTMTVKALRDALKDGKFTLEEIDKAGEIEARGAARATALKLLEKAYEARK